MMAKCLVFLITVLQCTSLFAEPVLFTCDRPAWEGKRGCGEANTYEKYAIYVNAETIHADRVADKEARGYLRPAHAFLKVRGCDLEAGYPKLGRFEVDADLITFWLGDVRIGEGIFAKKVMLDLETLSAEISKVDHSPVLTCTAQYVDAIPDVPGRAHTFEPPNPQALYPPPGYVPGGEVFR
jgi:hypothetical protein